MIAIVLSFSSVWAQNVKVSGKVTDNQGNPLVGVSVFVPDTKIGVTTDPNGSYSISAPSKATLVYSSLGYKEVRQVIGGRAVINVVLQENSEMLKDLVVVGFGTQRKANLTGAVAAIDASKVLESRPIPDVGRGLQGVTPGLNIRIGSSEIGSDAIIRIRGQVGSASGSASPLILLDNVEIPSLQLVNPDDVESISVLKDASSASIYGAKAAFGVILIQTKKGTVGGDAITATYSTNIAFQSMEKNYEVAGVDGLHYTVEAAERTGTYTPVGAFWKIDRAGYNAAVAWKNKYGNLDANSPMTYGRDWYVDGSNRKIGVRTYNPYDYLVRKVAPSQTHSLSIAGKTGKTTFNIGLGYLDQTGMMKTSDYDTYERYNANIRVSTQINKFINVRAGFMYSNATKNWAYATSSTTADIWYYVYRWGPTFPLVAKDEFGNDVRNGTYETSVANKAYDKTSYTSINLGTTITPLDHWSIDFDYTYADNETTSWRPGTSFYAGNTWVNPLDVTDNSGQVVTINNEWNEYNGLGSTINQKVLNVYRYTSSGSSPDLVYRDSYVSRRNTFNGTTSYDLAIGKNHKIKPMLGFNIVGYENEGNWSQITKLMDYSNPQFPLATGTQTASGGYDWSSTAGFFGRVNYSYKDRYLLEGNARYDGTSKFPDSLKWRWFYSFSGGWRVSEEPFMADLKDQINSLKLRASWGKIGDQSVASSLYIPTMSRVESSWLHDGAKSFYYTTPAAVASDITWQDIETFDIGADATVFHDFDFTVDWYQRNTNNMIVPAEGLGYGFGTTAPKGNYGDLRTRGYEIELNYHKIFSNGMSFAFTGTFADAKTKITNYGTGTLINNWYNGKTYGEIWGYKVDRLYQNDDFQWENGALVAGKDRSGKYNINLLFDPNAPTQGYLKSGTGGLGFGPGDVKFKDLNGDGVIDDGKGQVGDHGDLTIIGNTTPRYEYSFRFDFAYKGFDVSMFWQGIGQRDMWGYGSLTLPGFNTGDGCMAQAIAGDFWYETKDANGNVTDSNYDAFYPRAYNLGGARSGFNMVVNDKYLLNMAYLRLKNLTVGYTLPENISRKVYMKKLRVYASLENFLTFDHLHGIPVDPEVVSGYSTFNSTNYNSSRVGVGTPAFKTASLGLQLTF
jgi:TonB-linked SusC/RagA family outer membrane protein